MSTSNGADCESRNQQANQRVGWSRVSVADQYAGQFSLIGPLQCKPLVDSGEEHLKKGCY
uniref:Uncharacterized protein n=1 Tax=Anopheles albimanus TaxID=7167 RepID=A0A182FXM1_ANOAL